MILLSSLLVVSVIAAKLTGSPCEPVNPGEWNGLMTLSTALAPFLKDLLGPSLPAAMLGVKTLGLVQCLNLG